MAEKYESDLRFIELAGPIIKTEHFDKLRLTKHHNDSVFNHTLRVAYKAYRIGRRFRINEYELVRGALFHDLYFHDWRDKEFLYNHGWAHPVIALKNAKALFGPVSSREENIIVSHMWPFNIKTLPRHKEALIVIYSDKWVAMGEFALMAVDFFKHIFRQNRT